MSESELVAGRWTWFDGEMSSQARSGQIRRLPRYSVQPRRCQVGGVREGGNLESRCARVPSFFVSLGLIDARVGGAQQRPPSAQGHPTGGLTGHQPRFHPVPVPTTCQGPCRQVTRFLVVPDLSLGIRTASQAGARQGKAWSGMALALARHGHGHGHGHLAVAVNRGSGGYRELSLVKPSLNNVGDRLLRQGGGL